MKSLKTLWDKEKFEVTLRIGVICILGFSLAIAAIPNVLPPSQAIMPGVVVSSMSTAVPTLMVTLDIVYPLILVLFVVICGWSTVLLAAGTVSDGCFLGVYAAFTLFMTSLYFGRNYSMTSGIANLYIAMGGLLGVSYLPLVQQGGLSAVAAMWTESGTENQLAVWRNFLIAMCWALACIAIGILIPPWRTSRHYISRCMLPFIFTQVNGVLSGDDVDVRALGKSKTALKGGNVVMTTVFEPRPLQLYVDLVEPLKQIAVAADELIFRSLLVLKWKEGLTDAPNELETAVLKDTSTLLTACGKALVTNNQEDYNAMRDFVDDQTFERMAKVGSSYPTGSENPQLSQSSYIYNQALEVRTANLSYLRSFNNDIVKMTSKQKFTFFLKRGLLHVAAPMLPTFRLMEAPLLIFQPKKWNFTSISWCLELSAGFVALISMSLYWDAYAAFRITPKDSYVGAVWSGWQLMGYAFAWRPTHEGTVKKGIQRILGTALGGFFGWLSVIVCSWSYDDDAEINPYGLIAWLTIITMLCTYFWSLPSGVAAHFGQDKDHGYVAMYFTMTQALIALEVFLGSGDKNGLTLNRIVATITGVAMAVVISFLPPHVIGRDPEHTREYLNELNKAFRLLLETFADGKKSTQFKSGDFKKSLLSAAVKKRNFAVFVLNDADMLKILPLMRVNEKLRPLLDSLNVTEASISHLADGFAYIIENDYNVNETRTAVRALLQDVLDVGGDVTKSHLSHSTSKDLVVGSVYSVYRQLEKEKRALDEMEQ